MDVVVAFVATVIFFCMIAALCALPVFWVAWTLLWCAKSVLRRRPHRGLH